VSAATTVGLQPFHSEDFAQEARVRLLTVLRGQRGAAPEPYIRSVVVNAIRTARRSQARHSGREVALEETSEMPSAEGSQGGTDLFATNAVKRFIRPLPDKLRALYQLVYVLGWTQREAAKELRVTQPRVAQLHAELLQRGRRELGYLFQ
jgi:RNA polymerase sigma factor (sigma-70 family)